MITASKYVLPAFGENPAQGEHSQLWNSLCEQVYRIILVAQKIYNYALTLASNLYDISVKVVGLAVTGIQFTVAKVQELAIDISQINLNLIHIGDQTTIHHHVINFYTCPHCSYQTPSVSQPLGLAC